MISTSVRVRVLYCTFLFSCYDCYSTGTRTVDRVQPTSTRTSLTIISPSSIGFYEMCQSASESLRSRYPRGMNNNEQTTQLLFVKLGKGLSMRKFHFAVWLMFVVGYCSAWRPLESRAALVSSPLSTLQDRQGDWEQRGGSAHPVVIARTGLHGCLQLRGGGEGGIALALIKTAARNPILILCTLSKLSL